MGEHTNFKRSEPDQRTHYVQHLLQDIKSMEYMLEHNLIESGIARIGAEQEFAILDEHWRPAPKSDDFLKTVNDWHFTTELARYNVELNLEPLELNEHAFSTLEEQLKTLIYKADLAAKKNNLHMILTGVVPTISRQDLTIENLTPIPRYFLLNDLVKETRGSHFSVRINGVDELAIYHDSVLFEGCNTSFQMHLQIEPNEFVDKYNWAQAIAGPVLAISTNSPLLLGRELWAETRIALFKQSIDTRTSSFALKDQQARVTFGKKWEQGTIADIFREEVATHGVLLTKEIEKGSMEVLKEGQIPKLSAYNLLNGTIYRWNRACYGVNDGVAHVRIEARYIPAGPSILDEVANFAFWVGLMNGQPEHYRHVSEKMTFKDVKENFFKAARFGRQTVMYWNREEISVRDLILNELIPIARNGLQKVGIPDNEIERLLNVIRSRTIAQNSNIWTRRNYRKLLKRMKKDDALVTLTRAIHENQVTGKPVHEWPEIDEDTLPKLSTATQIGHIMSTELFVIKENDAANLATSIMEWKNIHHVPVVSGKNELIGLLTSRHMENQNCLDDANCRVKDIMERNVVSTGPDASIQEVIEIMKKNEFGCMPVVENGELIGIVTIKDVLPFDHT